MPVFPITTSAEADHFYNGDWNYWEIYARVKGQHDTSLPLRNCIRERDGYLEANIGDYTFDGLTLTPPLTERWVIPDLIYAKHQCSNCPYPPDLCCMAGNPPGSAWQRYGATFSYFDDEALLVLSASQ